MTILEYAFLTGLNFQLQSSDEEDPVEEEREVLRLQKEKALYMTAADFGLEDGLEDDSEHESDGEPTIGVSISTVTYDVCYCCLCLC